MRFCFVNYNTVRDGIDPIAWSQMIGPYWGILQELSSKHEVHYFIYSNSPAQKLIGNVRCHFIHGKLKGLLDGGIHRELSRLMPDLIFVYGLYFHKQILLLSFLFKRRSRIIVQSHSFLPARGWREYLDRLCYSRVDAYVFTSKFLADEWVRAGNFPNNHKILELMPAASFLHKVDRKVARARTSMKGNLNYLWVGRLNANKDPMTVIKAFNAFHCKHPSSRLHMIYQNDEMEQQIIALLDELHEHGVVLHGNVSNHELLYWYNSADYFISGSHHESFGIALSEAMSCGLYPIVTSIPSFRKITGNGSCGSLFEAGNVEALIRQMETAVNNNASSEGQKILDYYATNLSFKAIAKRLEYMVVEMRRPSSVVSHELTA